MAGMATAMNPPKFRRRKVLLRPGYQLRVAVTILVFIIFYSLLLGFLMFYPLQQEFATANPEQQFWIARQVLELHKRFWPSVLAVAVLVGFQSIFVTHRIVGPTYHLQRVLEGFAAGNYEMRARLRRWDRLKELETAVNGLGERLLQREQASRERAGRLRGVMEDLKTGITGANLASKVQQAVREMERLTANLPDAN